MEYTVKVENAGDEQIVILPESCQFDTGTDEVYIRRDPKTGSVILSLQPAAPVVEAS